MAWTGTNEMIAERRLTLETAAGNVQPVWVRIGKPARTPGHDDYYCEFQIEGLASERILTAKIHKVCGIDAFQALQLAQRTLVTILIDCKEKLRDRLYLDEPGDDIGLPNAMGFDGKRPN